MFSSPAVMCRAVQYAVESVSSPHSFSSSDRIWSCAAIRLASHPQHQDLDMVTVSALILIHRSAQPPCHCVVYHLVLAIPPVFNGNSFTETCRVLMYHKPCSDSVSTFLTMVTRLRRKRDLFEVEPEGGDREADTDSGAAAIRLSLHCLWRAVRTFNVAGQNGNTQRDGAGVQRNVRRLRNTAQLG